MDSALERLLTFFRFTHALTRTERVARTPGTERFANTAEHTLQVALVAWYVVDAHQLPLNREKVLKYALAHDSPEAYAGDAYIYDERARAEKERREHEARERMQREFPEFSELHGTIEAYEERADPESRFVYALDKIMDPANIFLEDGALWREHGVSLPRLLEYKNDKVALDDTVRGLFDALVVELRRREPELFGAPKA